MAAEEPAGQEDRQVGPEGREGGPNTPSKAMATTEPHGHGQGTQLGTHPALGHGDRAEKAEHWRLICSEGRGGFSGAQPQPWGSSALQGSLEHGEDGMPAPMEQDGCAGARRLQDLVWRMDDPWPSSSSSSAQPSPAEHGAVPQHGIWGVNSNPSPSQPCPWDLGAQFQSQPSGTLPV